MEGTQGEREMSQKLPTFKELLEKHHIAYTDFYETCMSVPTLDIDALYNHNQAVRHNLQKMIEHLNKMAGHRYTVRDVFTEKVYY